LQSPGEKGSFAPLRTGSRGFFLTAFHVLRGLERVPPLLKGCVVAIGNFDGCHRGHQHVLAEANAIAARTGRPSVMLTFEPHPRDVFAPEAFMFRLTDGEQKARLAAALGFAGIVIMPFSRTLAAVAADDFVQNFLVEALEVSAVVVGADFQFGRGREGTPQFLADAGDRKGFAVSRLPLLESEDQPVSSSRIRKALSVGDVHLANTLLGYHWLVEGAVISGDRRGRELGYPTANFSLPANSGLAQGVYAVRIRLGNRLLDGVASYGKPMFDNTQPPFEAHIFDFDEDIYGSHIEVALIGQLRGQSTFDSLDALITQMDADSAAARRMIGTARPLSELDRRLGYITGVQAVTPAAP